MPITTVAPMFVGVAVKSEPVMSTKRVRQNAAKAIVWLTVTMFALPVTPAMACHCATDTMASGCDCCSQRGRNSSEQPFAHCSPSGRHSCCSHNASTTRANCHNGSSVTQASSHCTCGSSCACKSGQPPAHPADPLAPQEDSPSKVGGGEPHATLSMPLALPTVRPLVACNAERVTCGSSLERCISLSRFTL